MVVGPGQRSVNNSTFNASGIIALLLRTPLFALLSPSSPSPALSEIVDLGLRLSSTASSDPYRVPWTSFRITSPLGTTKALLLRRAIRASSDASVILQAEGQDSLVAAFHDEGVQTARGRQFPPRLVPPSSAPVKTQHG